MPSSPPVNRPTPSRRRGFVGGLVALLMLGGAGAGAWVTATRAADLIEARTTQGLQRALAGGGYTWAEVAASGLTVTLTGTAPDEAARADALTEAGRVVDPARLADRMTVAGPGATVPPAVEVELLRNHTGLTLIGLIPTEADRRLLTARLSDDGAPAVTDLLEVADSPAPDGWEAAVAFGAEAIAAAPRAKVSIAPGRVSVTALAASVEDRAAIEARLTRAKPAEVTLTMAISAPRPVISPFTVRFVRDAEGARLDACAADSEAARSRILDAARAAGLGGSADCTLGLGAPSSTWADAAVPAIAAVGAMGAGSVTLTDAAMALDAPASVPRATFDEAVGRLQGALPPVFHLTATLEPPAVPDSGPAPAEFTATRAPGGPLALRGRVPDDRMRNVVESLARSRFPAIDAGLVTDAAVPDGWTVRVIAALEAMADLESGSARVTPDEIVIDGVSGRANASDLAAQALGRRLGAGADYRLAIRYDRRLDAALALPTGAQCVDRANAVMATSEIGFEPARPDIAGDPGPTMAALNDALRECGVFRLEVGGHTDSQGSEGGNMTLSQQRAAAIVAAMTAAGIDTGLMTAVGYGESRPLGTNETDAGREANRRIEFRLLSPDPIEPAAAAAAEVAGVTAQVAPDPAKPPLGLEPALSTVPAELMPPPPAAAPQQADPAAPTLAWPGGASDSALADRPVAVEPFDGNAPGVALSPFDGYIDPAEAGVTAD